MPCQFYLEKKKRNCRFQPKEGSSYCVEHACVLGIASEKKRIPCPLDPSHNCFEDNLEKHLKKCNVAKIRKASEQAEFFVKGVNLGKSESRLQNEQNDVQVAVSELTSDRLAAMIDKVNQLYKDHVEIPETCILEHPSVKVQVTSEIKVIADGSNDHSHLTDELTDNPNLRKELLQQASLVGQLASKDLLNATSWFVELGAGKGKLSHWVEKACDRVKSQSEGVPIDPSFLLVDRSSVRYKMDCFHKEDSGGSQFKRIKVDIGDLCLGLVSDIKDTDSIVVMGKHLCGGATDLGIRCAVDSIAISPGHNTGQDPQQKDTRESVSHRKLIHCSDSGQCDSQRTHEPPAKSLRLETEHEGKEVEQRLPKGIMIALCCHHRCTWESYIGQEFMQKCGVTPLEFDLLTRLSSWATCARVKKHQKAKETPREQKTDNALQANNKAVGTTSPSDEGDPETENSELNGKLKPHLTSQDGQGDHFALDMVSTQTSQGFRESLSVSQREEVGRKCKRIIDMGRLHYLRSKGMASSLREYVSQEITPENVVLLAVRS